MPTFRHGKSTDFSIDDTGGTLRDIADTLDNVDFPKTIETGETTAFGANSKSYIVGLTDHTISISGKWDATVDSYLAGGAEPASRSFSYSPDGGTTTYTGECIMTGYTTANPVGDVVTFSAEFQVTGDVVRT